MAERRFSFLAAAISGAVVLLLMATRIALGAPADADGWTTNPTFSLTFLGRDGPNGSDHYHVTLGWGASFFGIAADAMPLVPPLQGVAILQDGYKSTFPGRPLEDIQPGDSFEFYVPAGTLVGTESRQSGSTREYRSLNGDTLKIYTDFRSPIQYRLARASDPGHVEVMINYGPYVDVTANDLAKALYGADDPNFRPDVLQVARAKDALERKAPTVTVDASSPHLDDFWDIRAGGEKAGKTEEGLQIYWFRSNGEAQPLFRVDDGIGDITDPTALSSPMRVYYYKDGVVRVYLLTGDIAFLSGRQPKNDDWSKIFVQYGGLSPVPTRWDLGQPEDNAAAQEMNKLGVSVLRFEPRPPSRGNFFTQILDALMGLMKRKQG